MRSLSTAIVIFALAGASASMARDNGQYENVAPDIRAWFKRQISPSGVPCCDEADGHRTSYEVRGKSYFVPIDGLWWEVPERAIIRDQGNPVGEAVVWYVYHRGGVVINCFVPADAA